MTEFATQISVPAANEFPPSEDEMKNAVKDQLLADDAKIQSHIELLEQERYSLKVAYDAQSKTLAIQNEELEKEQKRNEILTEELFNSQKHAEEMMKKNKNLLKDNKYLSVMCEEKDVQAKKSLCEAESVKNRQMKDLKQKLVDIQSDFEVLKDHKEQLLKVVEELRATVSERDVEIQNIQEKNIELQQDIKRNNLVKSPSNMTESIFMELSEVKTKNPKCLQAQVKNKAELNDARADFATIESKVNDHNSDDEEKAFIKDCDTCSIFSEESKAMESDYLRVILKHSQMREKILLEESIVNNEKITNVEKQLHTARANLHYLKQDLKRVIIKSEKMDPDFRANCEHEAAINEMKLPKLEILDDYEKEEPHQRMEMKSCFKRAMMACFKCSVLACMFPQL